MDPLTIGNESPPARQSILGSFLRSRPRGTSQSHPSPPPHDPPATNDCPPSAAIPPSESTPGHRRRAAAPNIQTSLSQSASTPAFSQMLRRRRSAGTLATSATPQVPVVAVARSAVPASALSPSAAHRIRLVPHLDSRRSLRFDPICRDVREGDAPLRIGRFTDRSGLGLAAANALGSNKLAFKSKVVSRAHAEIWVEGSHFYIKDTKSSSGTFLNHVRLSAANAESRPSELKDGDLLQLGVDYQGGAEDIYKCVKIKIEMGREWQAHSNPFNANALKQLRAIAIPQLVPTEKKTISAKSALPDCCICLFPVTIHQALFIAPCSHAFHYKCLRPLLETHHPAFSCPLCRTFANLEEDVEVEVEFEADLDSAADISAIASVVAPAERPNTGDGSSRERDRDRDRDAGAETEVEVDTGASRIGVRGRRVLPPLPGTGDEDEEEEDVDAEMEDEAVLPPLPEGSPLVLAVDMDGDAMRDGSVSPMSGPMPAADSSEGEEGTGEVEGASDASGSAGGSARGEAAHGKRKR